MLGSQQLSQGLSPEVNQASIEESEMGVKHKLQPTSVRLLENIGQI